MMAVILLPGMEYVRPDELELDNGRELFFKSDLIFSGNYSTRCVNPRSQLVLMPFYKRKKMTVFVFYLIKLEG